MEIICSVIVDSVICWRYNNLSEKNKSFKRNEKREIEASSVLFALVTLRQIPYESAHRNEWYWEMP